MVVVHSSMHNIGRYVCEGIDTSTPGMMKLHFQKCNYTTSRQLFSDVLMLCNYTFEGVINFEGLQEIFPRGDQ